MLIVGGSWLLLGGVLGPFIVPIAIERASRNPATRAGDGAGQAVIETQILAGQPAAAVLELADEEDVDLIVVGRRGRGSSRTVLGSAASTLSAHARCSVLLAAQPDVRP